MAYSHAISIEHNLARGPLWDFKHNQEDLERLKATDPYVFDAQIQQEPAPKGGVIFKPKWWQYYKVLPDFDYRIITADTAQKEGEENDFSVFQLWGAVGRRIYLVDQLRAKFEAPELKSNAIAFWNKHVNAHGILRGMFVEDKVSGTSLVQEISRDGRFPIVPVQRAKSKIVRYMNIAPSLASGLVYLPEEAEWLLDYTEEFRKITPLMTHKHDDQVDPTADAIELMVLNYIEPLPPESEVKKDERSIGLEGEDLYSGSVSNFQQYDTDGLF